MRYDPYTYDNGTLVNKLNIKDYKKLNQAEADIGFLKLIDIDTIECYEFDSSLLKKIHKHIFEDIFYWAGEYRSIPIVKEELVLPGLSLDYADASVIEKSLKYGLNDLNNTVWDDLDIDELCYKFARKIAVLWKIHPFRDGNTRTFLSFAYLFAKEKGFPLDIEFFANELSRKFDDTGKVLKYSIRDRFVLACLDDNDYPEVEYLASVFKNSMLYYKNEKKTK